MERRERWVALVTLALLHVFVVVTGVYVIANDVSLDAMTGRAPRPTASAEPPSVPVVTAGPVLAAGGNGPLPSKGTLAARLGKALGDPALGDRVGAAVLDARTGAALFGSGQTVGITPASTTKVVTSVAALASLGADARLATTVVQGGSKTSIVLVGGGDPTLQGPRAPKEAPYPRPATIATLASRTAKALKAAGVTKVTLSYDTSLFTGSPLGPGWKPGYVPEGSVAPVSALMIDEGRVSPDSRQRVADPARTAAAAFAAQLSKAGVRVVNKTIKPARAAAGAKELARVESAPVYALVERTLTLSDNDLAEALARHVALKEGLPGSFEGGSAGVRRVLQRLKAADGIRTYDGSGLSTRNRITASGLAKLLAVAVSPDNPQLHPVISGMPVAGFSGTLGHRFESKAAEPGVGLVRAKTGTLNGVNTLAGVVTTSDGRLVTFAFMADKVPPAWGKAEAALDRLATIVSGCGC